MLCHFRVMKTKLKIQWHFSLKKRFPLHTQQWGSAIVCNRVQGWKFAGHLIVGGNFQKFSERLGTTLKSGSFETHHIFSHLCTMVS